MSEPKTDPITEALNELNAELEENRKQSERLKAMSEQIHSEVEQNKKDRVRIEKALDAVYFQITQSKLS